MPPPQTKAGIQWGDSLCLSHLRRQVYHARFNEEPEEGGYLFFSLPEIIRYEVTVNRRNIEGKFAYLLVTRQNWVSAALERLASALLSHPRRWRTILVPMGCSLPIPLTAASDLFQACG